MTDTANPGTELVSQYATQVSDDLDRNTKEQERLTAEIAALQEQLATLQRDHSVLVNIRQALAGTAELVGAALPSPRTETTGTAEAESAEAEAPEAESDGGSTRGRKARAKKSAPAQRRTAKKAPAGKASAKSPAKAKKAGAPTLGELILGVLTEQSEPRSAAEVAAALNEAHPERPVKTTVTRNTLEGLVAKNQVQRTKQGTSVFYTAPVASASAGTSGPEAGADQGE
jgi:hypothetical protein